MPKIIAANWKMNFTVREAVSYVKDFKGFVKDSENEIILCVPYTVLSELKRELKGTKIKLGAENVYCKDSGSYTSEISPVMLKELCEYVIIGHSERRIYFNEDNKLLNEKVKAALKNGLKVIYCIGEKLEERKNGMTNAILKKQLDEGLEGVELNPNKIIIAYEPVWAIAGFQKTKEKLSAKPEDAENAHKFIKELVGNKIKVLYGGSVNPENCKELLSIKEIDGALVGTASWDAKKFAEIVNFN